MSYKILATNIGGLLLSIICLFTENNPFFLLVVLGVLNSVLFLKLQKGYITSVFAWNMGFTFIIGFDGLFNFRKIEALISTSALLTSSLMFIISYFLINILYIIIRRPKGQNIFDISRYDRVNYLGFAFIALLYALFIAEQLPRAVQVIMSGRAFAIANSQFGGLSSATREISDTVLGYFSNYAGMILPTLIFYYVRTRSKLHFKWVIIFCLPIVLIQLMSGTRYYLLFSVGTLLITYAFFHNYRVKRALMVILLLLLGKLVGDTMINLRSKGGWDALLHSRYSEVIGVDFEQSESTVKYMTMVTDHYSTNSFDLGHNLFSILVFWVPRSIWKDKPTQFGYWFVRSYQGNDEMSSKNSTPASYLAEAYADFGVLGVLLVTFIFSFFFLTVDSRIMDFKNRFTLHQIILYFLVPATFFLPRQINVSVTVTIGILLLILLLKRMSSSCFNGSPLNIPSGV